MTSNFTTIKSQKGSNMPGGLIAALIVVGVLAVVGLIVYLVVRSVTQVPQLRAERNQLRTVVNEIDYLVTDNYNYLDLPGQSLADTIRGKIRTTREEIE